MDARKRTYLKPVEAVEPHPLASRVPHDKPLNLTLGLVRNAAQCGEEERVLRREGLGDDIGLCFHLACHATTASEAVSEHSRPHPW